MARDLGGLDEDRGPDDGARNHCGCIQTRQRSRQFGHDVAEEYPEGRVLASDLK